MSRRTLALDRFLALVLGLVLLVGGAALVAWPTGWLDQLLGQEAGTLSTGPVTDALGASWWTGAAAAAAVVLAVLAVWWLVAHVPRQSAGTLTLTGSGRSGQLTIDPDGPAQAAADELATVAGVRSARGTVNRERGRLVVVLDATVEQRADLAEIAAEADRITATLYHVLGRRDARARVRLSVARRDRSYDRVS